MSTHSPLDTPAPLALRTMVDADLPFLQALYASTREQEMAQTQWSDQQKAEFLAFQFDAQHKHYQKHFSSANFDIVEMEGQPIGRLYVEYRDDEIRIVDIALLPEYRNRGFGQSLLKAVMQAGQDRKQPISIHVEQFNPAMRLYIRLGFEKTADQGVYDLMTWSPHT